MSDENTIANAADAPESTFKRWVKDYCTIDAEIKSAGAAMTAMRKRKKMLDDAILQWMQTNDVARVHLREDEFLERNIKSSAKPLNAEVIGEVLEEFFQGDGERAASLTALIYNGRHEEEKEVLKVATVSRKRQRLRPVDGVSVNDQ